MKRKKNFLIYYLEKENLFFKYVISVYEAFRVLQNAHTTHEFNSRIESTTWIGLRALLKTLLKKSPTIYTFLDSIDIEYEHAPRQWLVCQKGLFYAVMDFLQDNLFGEKLHIIMSMRSNVFSSVLRSEHNTKFSNESHIFYLNWNWLGSSKIRNLKRHTEENLSHYLIRHTRLVPRDIVILGNKLSILKRQYTQDKSICIEDRIREIVAKCACAFGEELITICAKNIVAYQIPNGSGRNGYSDSFLLNDVFQRSSYDKLKKILSEFKTDRIKEEDLNRINELAKNEFGQTIDLLDILWQNEAIGYIDDDGISQYYIQNSNTDNHLPNNKKYYVLRTCLIDALSLNCADTPPEKPS